MWMDVFGDGMCSRITKFILLNGCNDDNNDCCNCIAVYIKRKSVGICTYKIGKIIP